MAGLSDILNSLSPDERSQMMQYSLGGAAGAAAQYMGASRYPVELGQVIAAAGGGAAQGRALGVRQAIMGHEAAQRDQYYQSLSDEQAQKTAAAADKQAARERFMATATPEQKRMAETIGLYGADGAKLFEPPGSASAVGKIEDDYKAGRIDKATRDALIHRATYIAPVGGGDAGANEIVDPKTVEAMGFKPGTVLQHNKRTNAYDVKQQGQTPLEAGMFGGKSEEAQALNIIDDTLNRVAKGEKLSDQDKRRYTLARQVVMQPKPVFDSASGMVLQTTPTFSIPEDPEAAGSPAPAAPPPVAPAPSQPSPPDTQGPMGYTDPGGQSGGGTLPPRTPTAPPQAPVTPPASATIRVTPNVTATPMPGRSPGNEAQQKAAGYRDRLIEADKLITKYGGAGTSMFQSGLDYVPGGKFLKSSDRLALEQAQRDFANANLRQESGAVINPDEFANSAKQYFPQPEDSPEVLKQKAANRATIINNFKRMAGPVPDVAGSFGGISPEEAAGLPPGTEFTGLDGVKRTRH